MKLIIVCKGGPGSGYFQSAGHKGIPGKVGGSAGGSTSEVVVLPPMQLGEKREVGVVWSKYLGDTPIVVEKKLETHLFTTAGRDIRWSIRDDGRQHGSVTMSRSSKAKAGIKREFDDYEKFRKDARNRLLADLPELSTLLKSIGRQELR